MTRHTRPPAGRLGALGLGLALAVWPPGVRAQGPATPPLAIDHEPPGCLVAERYARLSACFRPAGAVARGRVYFRARGTEDWLYVEMTGEAPCLEAVLPRPRKDAGAVEYSVAGLDRHLVEARTGEYTVPVTTAPTCVRGSVAPVVESAAVIIGSSSGAGPEGFLTGDGLRTGLILGLVGGGAAVATTAVLLSGEDEGDRPPPASTARPTPSWRTALAVPGGRGHVTVDGTPAGWFAPGVGSPSLALGPGPHRVEAVLVDGEGRPGSWTFDLTAVDVVPGSLQVVAGEGEPMGAGQVTFRLCGEPGERLAVTFRVGTR